MKKVVYVLITNLMILTASLFAQEVPEVSISGKVIDFSSKQPIENVDVFLSFTTRGDMTDRNGVFRIDHVPAGNYLLVVSLIGYEVKKLEIEVSEQSKNMYNFKLKQKAIDAPKLEVNATKADGWKRNFNRFEDIFLGLSSNAKKCTILNPEYIDFNFSEQSHYLTATSNQPIKVENKALGYQVEFTLLDFLSANYFNTQFMVTAKFTPLVPENEKGDKRWHKNRKKAYLGSRRHFFAALARNRLEEEKFEVYHTSKITISQQGAYYKLFNIEEVVGKGFMEYERVLSFDDYLKIIYFGEYEPVEYSHDSPAIKHHQTSWIELTQKPLIVNTDGILYKPYAVVTYGYWAWERAAEMLPLDYKPEQN